MTAAAGSVIVVMPSARRSVAWLSARSTIDAA